MRIFGLYSAFAFAALIAGCGGTTASPAPSVFTPVAMDASHAQRHSAHGGPCGDNGNGCDRLLLIAPLQYDGSHFSAVSVASCTNVQIGDAPNYASTASGPITVAGKLGFMQPSCAPTSAPSQIEIVGVAVKPDGNSGRYHGAPREFVDVADAIYFSDTTWGFATATPGMSLNAGSTYEFFFAVPNN